MRDNLRRLVSEAMNLLKMVGDDGIPEYEKEKRVANLLMEVIQFVTGSEGGNPEMKRRRPDTPEVGGGTDATATATEATAPTAGSNQPTTEASTASNQQTTSAPKQSTFSFPLPVPSSTSTKQTTKGNAKASYPEWHVHGAWAGTVSTINYDVAANATNNLASGLVLVRSKQDWEALRQTKKSGRWAAISKVPLTKSTVPVAIPVIKKGGVCEIRRVFYTHICGEDFSKATSEIQHPTPDPVLFVQDWGKSSEKDLTIKTKELLKKKKINAAPFSYKRNDSHSSMAIRIPRNQVHKILEFNNNDPETDKPKNVFVRNPSWSNGSDVWPTLQFNNDLGFLAAKSKTSILEGFEGKFYLCKFKTCYGLRVHPDCNTEVRIKLSASLKPALPSGDRYIIKSMAIRKFSTAQISDFMKSSHNWEHTVVASFNKGGSTTIVAISNTQPPNFVSIGTNEYLVINKEVKKSDRKPLGPTYNPGDAAQKLTGTLKRQKTAPQPQQPTQLPHQTAAAPTPAPAPTPASAPPPTESAVKQEGDKNGDVEMEDDDSDFDLN